MKTFLFQSKTLSAVSLLFLLSTAACDRAHFRSIASTQTDLAVTPTPTTPTEPPFEIPVDPVPVPPNPPVITPPQAPEPPVVVVPPTPVPPVVTPPVVPQPPIITPPPVPTPPVVVLPPTPVPPVVTPPVVPNPPVITPPQAPVPPVVVLPPTPVPPVVTPPIVPQPPVITPPPAPTPPVVVVPPTPVPPVLPPIATPVLKAGACADDSSTRLLSCLNCNVPMNPPAPPQFSDKGRAFIEIMTIGCAISNKSAPKGYVPPTRAELYARFNRLSPVFYPDTAMSSGQKETISGLLTNQELQQKVFGGLYYKPPYSDNYETYFGISVGEAMNYVCYKNNNSTFSLNGSAQLQSKTYIDCLYSDNSFNCKEKPEYVAANNYREQLRLAMIESIYRPYVPPAPTPAKKCTWQSFEGDYDLGAEKTLSTWLTSGYSIGIEISNLAGRCESVTSLPTGSMKPRGIVKMSGYICK